MSSPGRLPAVSHDTLLAGRVCFDQPLQGYRAAIDPVFLAAAIPASPGDTVLEFGSGAGAASLCLAARVPDCRIIGIEQDAAIVALANANAALNGMNGRLQFHIGNIQDSLPETGIESFDHVFANPPYLEPERADTRDPGNAPRHAATIESGAGVSAWVRAMCAAVKPRGRITLIHRADRLADILSELQIHAGDITVFPLWPKAGRAARRVIVSGRPKTAAPFKLLSGLVLHDDDGQFSTEAKTVLDAAMALDLLVSVKGST